MLQGQLYLYENFIRCMIYVLLSSHIASQLQRPVTYAPYKCNHCLIILLETYDVRMHISTVFVESAEFLYAEAIASYNYHFVLSNDCFSYLWLSEISVWDALRLIGYRISQIYPFRWIERLRISYQNMVRAVVKVFRMLLKYRCSE
jgi:hypothetical protein